MPMDPQELMQETANQKSNIFAPRGIDREELNLPIRRIAEARLRNSPAIFPQAMTAPLPVMILLRECQ